MVGFVFLSIRENDFANGIREAAESAKGAFRPSVHIPDSNHFDWNPDRVDCGSGSFAAKLDLFEEGFGEGIGRVSQSGDPARRRQHIADQLDALAGQPIAGRAQQSGPMGDRRTQ